jgi:DNA-binding NtrC family response regulator
MRTTRRTILLVEADASLRRVIALGMQSRDLRVVEVASVSQVSDPIAQQAAMMVVDIDGEVGNSHELLAEIEAHPHLSSLPVILLAWDTSLNLDGRSNDVDDRVIRLAKPFDARSLSNAIESLLATGERISRLALQRTELRTTPSAPSICPMVTAAGLMLALIGLMLQLAVTAVGLLIVVIALLCWSLGPRSQSKESMLMQG